MSGISKNTQPAHVTAKRRGANSRGRDVQSVDRALSILEVIGGAGDGLALSEIAARLGLNASTCHHLIATLVSRKYVARAPKRGTYMLGPQVLALASQVNWQDDLPRRAEPLMDELNQATGEAVHFAVLRGDELVTLVKRDALHALRVDTSAGGKAVACHATATGKAILAWMKPADVRALLKRHGMPRFTSHTITKPNELIKELVTIRKSGIAMDWEEFQPHVVCVGAAVHDHAGAVVGAISVSSPTPRVDDAHIEHVQEEVVRIARLLSTGKPHFTDQGPPSAEDGCSRSRNPAPKRTSTSATNARKRKRENG